MLVITNLRGAFIGPLDLTVAAGTCAAITGPSGAGKSLFLRMIADLDCNEGSVHLGDVSRDRLPAPDWRRLAIHVAAEAAWWADQVGAHFSPPERSIAEPLAERLRLPPDTFDRAVRTLSTGERQRLSLVRALSRRPDCLLLDEPTSALDPHAVETVEALLRDEMARGLVLVLVSHDEAQARRLGTAHYTLAAGRLARA